MFLACVCSTGSALMWGERSINCKVSQKHCSRSRQSVNPFSGQGICCAQNVQNEFRGRGGQHAYNTIMLHTQPSIPSSLKFKWAAPEMVEGALLDDDGGETALPSMPFLLPGALHPPKPMPEALLLAESF